MPDNGDLKPEQKEEKIDKPQVVIQVIKNPDGKCEMKTSMTPPLVVWLFLQFIFSLLANSLGYSNENKIIIPHKHGMLNFARNIFRR